MTTTTKAPRPVSLHRQSPATPLASRAAQFGREWSTAHHGPTPEHPLYISASEVSSFLRCRVRHHWGNTYTPNTKSVPRSMGILGHQILEAWYRLPFADRTTDAMRTAAARVLNACAVEEVAIEHRDLLLEMVLGYAAWCMHPDTAHSDVAIGLEDCTPEAWFDEGLTADGSIRIRGRLDTLFFSTTLPNTAGVLESKFKGRIEDAEENRLQDSVYLWAMRRKFPEMERFTLYYQTLRKQLPGPRVKAPLFSRERIERTDAELAQFEFDIQNIALEMLDGAIYPTRSVQCKWDCDFAVPCLLRGKPADVAYVLETEYTAREVTR